MDTLSGVIEEVTFHNDENGFTVFVLEHDEEYTTCVGVLPELAPGERVDLTGKWGVHPVFGDQFKVDTFNLHIPTTTEDIYAYLSSGIIYGVGTTTAKRLIEEFGDETLDVLGNNPEMVAGVKGIGKKRAIKICESYNEHMASREVMIKLTHFGITANQATKLYLTYGNSAVAIVKANPYRMIEDIKGIGFKTADVIAMNMGVEKDNPLRLEAGITYVRSLGMMNGHVFLPKEVLLENGESILECSKEKLSEVLTNLIFVGKINDENGDV
ncbi:MAG: ATP-dependent RecD-like DNA helicase, partial [Clostridia bacterium]|nr:ATP-dependent RecD-like DNA helicase [Clostridia bacterium]